MNNLCCCCFDEMYSSYQCSHDPREVSNTGMYHCPVCGAMVIAGMEHPPICERCHRACK